MVDLVFTTLFDLRLSRIAAVAVWHPFQMQVGLFLLHKGLIQAQELPSRLFLGLEILFFCRPLDPYYLPQCVKLVFTTLSKKLHSLSHGGLHFWFEETTRRRIFRLKGDHAP